MIVLLKKAIPCNKLEFKAKKTQFLLNDVFILYHCYFLESSLKTQITLNYCTTL